MSICLSQFLSTASALRTISDIDSFATSLHSDACIRMALTSALITEFVTNVSVDWNSACLVASQAIMTAEKHNLLKRVLDFNNICIYNSPTVCSFSTRFYFFTPKQQAILAEENVISVVSDLWRACFDNPQLIDRDILAANDVADDMKRGWNRGRDKILGKTAGDIARAAADFVGGMTDTFARRFHAKLFAAHLPPTF